MRYQRLLEDDKEKIRNCYQKNILFKLLRFPCDALMSDSGCIRICPELLFGECMEVIDNIKEAPEDARIYLKGLWMSKFGFYRNEDDKSLDKEAALIASLITYLVMICLDASRRRYYKRLVPGLMLQLQANGDMYHVIHNRCWVEFGPKLQEIINFVNDYMSSDKFISDDIEFLISGSLLRNLSAEDALKAIESEITDIQFWYFPFRVLADRGDYKKKNYTAFCRDLASYGITNNIPKVQNLSLFGKKFDKDKDILEYKKTDPLRTTYNTGFDIAHKFNSMLKKKE